MGCRDNHMLLEMDVSLGAVLEPTGFGLAFSLLISGCLRLVAWAFNIVASSCDMYFSTISRHKSLGHDLASGKSVWAADSSFSVVCMETRMWSIIISVFSAFESCFQLPKEENSFHRLLSSFIQRTAVIQSKSCSGCLSKTLTESARILKIQNTWCSPYCKEGS